MYTTFFVNYKSLINNYIIIENMASLGGKLAVTLTELDIAKVLLSGQSFRWRKEGEELVGVVGGRVWGLKQSPSHVHYRILGGEESSPELLESALSKYFQLEVSLPALYAKWGEKDGRFKEMSQEWGGIRILAQEPVETIFSFICSANNHIGRIGGMVEKLCSLYGTPIIQTDITQDNPNVRIYHKFPSLEALSKPGVEATLRKEAFGYRAGYIANSAQKILEFGGREWVEGLKGMTYLEARTNLQSLPGIGRKVADCICLMSLGFSETVPVDTHIHQVAKTYLPHLAKAKTLTDKVYAEITQHFQSLHGQYAGWAQAVLFASRLKHLKTPAGENEQPKETKTKAKKNKKAVSSLKTETVTKDTQNNDLQNEEESSSRQSRSKRSRINK